MAFGFRPNTRSLSVVFSFLAASLLTSCGGKSAGGNPLATTYSVNAPAGSKVSVEFGTDTNYGLQTSSQSAPAGGGNVNVIVAGMRPETTYHMRARAVQADGSTVLDADRTYKTGSLDSSQFPKFKARATSVLAAGLN